MSLVGETHVYKNMISEEVIETECFENSTEYMFVGKCENVGETMVVGEEIEVKGDMDTVQEISVTNECKTNEDQVFMQENFDIPAEIPIDYETESEIRSDWIDDTKKRSTADTNIEESEADISANEDTNQEQDGDEETIATFVTANGQQLALYAVEDSEDIFAVAVYDESGEPPTNFQFLMKADVERLIGEGAVRTVKKPTQIKKQLLTTHPPILISEENSIGHAYDLDEGKSVIQQTDKEHSIWNGNTDSAEDCEVNGKDSTNYIYATSNKESDVTYVMMDDSTNIDDIDEKDLESDHEVLEQSTVQYILFEGDQSDSELTFDEIQATLQNFKSLDSKSSVTSSSRKQQKNHNNLDRIINFSSTDYKYCHTNYEDSNEMCTTLTEKHLNMLKDRQDLLDVLSDNISSPTTDIAKQAVLNTSAESESPIEIRAKRSRKQQLISVNREDSEIIIQPASFLAEEEHVIRKRGKRRRRIVPYSEHYHRTRESRRVRKIKRHREVEVIEIDVDEEERGRNDVVEITLDDNKDKYSSDKENEVIMVGDSDEELHEKDKKSPTTILKCEFCARNFRQRRALDTHLRVCSKSPSNAMKLRTQKFNEMERETVKKEYSCKVCQKKFDVVVALARHVRAEHSQRKKRQISKTSIEEVPEKPAEVHQKSHIVVPRSQKKRRSQHPSSVWDTKKLNCTDCGRWFPSTALLKAHCLQHATKKSEQQVRKCQLCKKLIKSRMLFIRHLRMHSRMKQSTNSVRNTLEKKLRTIKQVPHRITTLRKRGRPRKL